MLKSLIETRLNALLSFIFQHSLFKRKRSIVFKFLIGILILYIIVSFLFMFGGFFFGICQPMCSTGSTWLYFGIAAIVAMVLCFIGSAFMTKAQLFDAQDNELLISMPIPPSYILLSRMLMLLVLNYVFELLVLGPAGIVYIMNYPATVTGVIFFVFEFLFLPLITLTLSCIFGWLLTVISARVRNKSLISTIMSLAFLALYFYFFSQINEYLQSLIQNIDNVGLKIKNTVFPIYHFGLAIAEGSFLSLILFLLFATIPFAIAYAILSRYFIRISTTKKGFTRIKYQEKPLKVGSAKSALLKKELKLFSSNSMYIINASLGVVFTLIFAVALVIYRDLPMLVIQNIPELAQYINPLVITALCVLASTNIISAPSISLEGKSLWIVQSLPIDGGDVLLSKAKMHMVICLPSVFITSLVCVFTMNLSPIQILIVLVLPELVTIFCALLGVVTNLHFPKFDWINETVAVKQSMSTAITMFASIAVVVLPALLYGLLLIETMVLEVYMLIYAVILGALCLWMYRYLKTRGSAIFPFLD